MGAQRASRHVTKSNFRDPHELWRKCNRAQAGPSEIGSRCEKPRTQPRKGLEGAVQAKETLKGVGGQNEGQGLLGEKCRGGRGLELRAVGVGGMSDGPPSAPCSTLLQVCANAPSPPREEPPGKGPQ